MQLSVLLHDAGFELSKAFEPATHVFSPLIAKDERCLASERLAHPIIATIWQGSPHGHVGESARLMLWCTMPHASRPNLAAPFPPLSTISLPNTLKGVGVQCIKISPSNWRVLSCTHSMATRPDLCFGFLVGLVVGKDDDR